MGVKMEFDHLLKLIQTVSDSALTEFDFEGDGVKLSLRADRSNGPSTIVTSTGFSGPVPAAADDQPADSPEQQAGILITSPLVGIFYGAPAEDAENFVRIGDSVRKGQTLAIVEAMKLMNEIASEMDGTVAEVYAASGETVEYGQALFRIE